MSVLEKETSGGEHAHHHEEPFWRKYIFSQDHKVIGIQYGFTALLFLLFGFCLMLLMRWQLAYPGKADPVIGGLLGQANAPGGIMLPEFYNQLGAMHGTIMVFLAIVPLAVGAFGNYVVPLQIGARTWRFRSSTWRATGLLRRRRRHVGELLRAGRRGQLGLDVVRAAVEHRHRAARPGGCGHGLPDHVVAAGLGELHRDHLPARAPGLTLMRLPFFVWAQLVTSFLLLLAFPPLEAAAFCS